MQPRHIGDGKNNGNDNIKIHMVNQKRHNQKWPQASALISTESRYPVAQFVVARRPLG